MQGRFIDAYPRRTIRPSYQDKLKDTRWIKLAARVKDAADWKCEDCGRTDNGLEAHHCAYIPGREPWDYTINELMALCRGCHEWRQSREDAFRLSLGQICRHLPKAQLEDEVWRIIHDVSVRETARLASAFNQSEAE